MSVRSRQLVYYDDVIVFSKTRKELPHHIEEMLKLQINAGMTKNLRMFSFLS